MSQLNREGKTIAVSGDSPEEALVSKDFPKATIRYYTSIIPAYTEVADGRIDACIHARITMLIVTHEMSFAKAICNRVFYIDEGRIYEEGPPDQVFDHPRNEKTRRFIHRLKVLELEIHGKNYDFPGAQAQIIGYCEKNQISRRMDTHLQLAFEETVQQMLIPMLENPDIRTCIEYSPEEEKAVFTIRYGGERLDLTAQEDQLSLAILKGMAEGIRYIYHPEDELRNEIVMMFTPNHGGAFSGGKPGSMAEWWKR